MPFGGLRFFLRELGDNTSELQDLMINCIHLIFVFEQVILVNVFDLKLVVFCPARLDTVTIIEYLE